jgi:hypothetical protein
MRLLALLCIALLPSLCLGQTTVPAATQQAAVTQPASQPTQPVRSEALLSALDKAVAASGEGKTLDHLQDLGKGPGAWAKFKGFFTFVNIVIVTAAFLLVVALVWLVGLYFLAIMVAMPPLMHEIIIYGAVAALLVYARRVGVEHQLFLILPAALIFYCGVLYTRFRHFDKTASRTEAPDRSRYFSSDGNSKSTIALVTGLVWAAIAIVFASQVVGFLAVLAFFVAVGFSFFVVPGVVGIGFEDEDVVPRATFAAFVFLVIHVLSVLSPSFVPWWYKFFATGVAFMGTFVYFLGLLIVSSKWYSKDNWVLLNIVTVISGVAAMYLGSSYYIPLLLGVAGTFFYLYIIELYYEIPWSGKGWAWSLLGLSLLLYGFAYFAQRHPQYFLWNAA